MQYLCNERLTDLRRPFFDVNDYAFKSYKTVKSRCISRPPFYSQPAFCIKFAIKLEHTNLND